MYNSIYYALTHLAACGLESIFEAHYQCETPRKTPSSL